MNGIILIDKPKNLTSRDVVTKIGYIIGNKHIGHTGTLDPMATGVLVLCVGNATKISELITSYDKEYTAEVTLGIETDTLDIEGSIISEYNDIKVTKEQIEKVLKQFVGKIEQEVPAYSAIKIKGRRLYSYARKNIEVELPKKEIEIYYVSLINNLYNVDGKIKFLIKCHVSKGTYIRSLIRDIGQKLGYPACMSSLRRTRQGPFKIDNCYTVDDIEKGNFKMISIKEALSNISEMVINSDLEVKVRNGCIIDKILDDDIVKIINQEGELLAIYKTYELDCSKIKPYKMLIK
ncbi:MAG: tRNA pseudouridine(55) synthase TruB [Bacilli bacterium]|jgi:tRNA pseudouridine55 synthase